MYCPILRQAMLGDIAELLHIEKASFPGDTISKRSWRRLIGGAAANVVVAEDVRDLFGAYVVLFSSRTSVARLYSIAVAPEHRHQGVANLLLQDCIVRALAHGSTRLRLETRIDNLTAQKLFAKQGFVPFRRLRDYYADGADAIRYERQLVAM